MAFKGKFAYTLVCVQVIFILLFAFFVDYGEEMDATSPKNYYLDSSKSKENGFHNSYPMFQDISAMIFIGVGFLYSFLKKYGYSGIGMTMLLTGISMQWSILTKNWWNASDGKVHIDISSLMSGEFAAASTVIALGGVFGKISPLQMIIFTLLEVFVYTTNEHWCVTGFNIADAGGSVSLHMYAGLFGLAVAYTADRNAKVQNNQNEATSYESNIFCLFGTVLLWVFWPSFNAGLSKGDAQYRCAMNTFLAMLGSCVTAFAVSSLLNKKNKFTPSHIQNATLAGGVAIGTCGEMMVQPYGALIIGALGGVISVFGFKYLGAFLAKLKVYDPCGIHSLHALPGLFAGLTGIVAALFATESRYGHSLYKLYPAMAPLHNTSALLDIQIHSPDVGAGAGRTASIQACYQLLYVVDCIVVAIVTGLLTGSVLRLRIFDPIDEKEMYLDDTFWIVPETEEKKRISVSTIDSKL